jgi:hypothetical protein
MDIMDIDPNRKVIFIPILRDILYTFKVENQDCREFYGQDYSTKQFAFEIELVKVELLKKKVELYEAKKSKIKIGEIYDFGMTNPSLKRIQEFLRENDNLKHFRANELVFEYERKGEKKQTTHNYHLLK